MQRTMDVQVWMVEDDGVWMRTWYDDDKIMVVRVCVLLNVWLYGRVSGMYRGNGERTQDVCICEVMMDDVKP